MASGMSVTRFTGGNSFIFGRKKTVVAIDEAKKQYTQVLEEFKASLKTYDANLLAQFECLCKNRSPPNQDDVVRTITVITNRVAEKHTNHSRKNATNVSGFLEKLIKLAPVGDVIVGGAQNLAASGAWGAVRLALEVSVSYLSFFEKVSDLFLEIGKFTEINHELAMLFPHSLSLKALALEYLSTVIQVATKIFSYAQKSRMKQVLSSVFADFETSFGPLTTKLQTLAESIKSSAMVEAAKANQLEHRATQKGIHQLMAFSRNDSEKKGLDDWRYRIAQHLSSGGKNYGHKWSYYFGKGRSKWLLKGDEYAEWKESKTSRTFWLHGKLGSGKSVALASICSDMAASASSGTQKSPHTVSYFFCKDGETRSALASTIMDSIAAQIVMSSSMASAFDDYLKNVGGPRALATASTSCVELLLGFTPENWNCSIVIDGLDQLSSGEAEDLFGQLSQLSRSRLVLLCCSSHPTWEPFRKIQSLLYDVCKFTTASMDSIDRSSEASNFITAEISKWERRGWHFPSSDSKERVMQALMDHWDNMFLWLKLQMELIEDDLRDKDGYEIEYILARIHDDLSTLYERRLSEVAKAENPLSCVILQLVVGADPAMKVNELRIAANIQPGNMDWSPASLPRSGSVLCRQHGGKLLEVDDATDEVRLIHGSVAVHLCEPPRSQLTAHLHFSYLSARNLVGLVCMTYLNIPNLNQSLVVRPRSAEPGPNQTTGMARVAHNVIDDSGLDRHLLAPVFRGTKGRFNNSTDASAFLGSMVTRQAAAYVLTDFLNYAKGNCLTATRSLVLTGDHEIMLNLVIGGNMLPRQLAKLLRDPKTGILWAIANGHRGLFSQYVIDRQASKVQLSEEHSIQLMNLLLSEWRDFNHIGPHPVLTDFISWLYETHTTVFRTNMAVLLRIAYISDNAPARRPEFPMPKRTKISNSVALDFLRHLLKTRMEAGEFSAVLYYLKGDLKDKINENTIQSDDDSQLTVTPMAYAIEKEYDAVERIEALIDAGASSNEYPGGHGTPLLTAVIKGNVEVVQTLLYDGADVNKKVSHYRANIKAKVPHYRANVRQKAGTDDRTTPLIVAVEKQEVKVIKCLLGHGARLYDSNPFGHTPLHIAARDGDLATLECLVSYVRGETVIFESVDNMGNTALFDALRFKNTRCAEVLVEGGAKKLLEVKGEIWDVVTVKGHVHTPWAFECLLEECPKLDDEVRLSGLLDHHLNQSLIVMESSAAIRKRVAPKSPAKLVM